MLFTVVMFRVWPQIEHVEPQLNGMRARQHQVVRKVVSPVDLRGIAVRSYASAIAGQIAKASAPSD